MISKTIPYIVLALSTVHSFAIAEKGSVTISGELKQWHAVTLDLEGPEATEEDAAPNPFTDLRFDVTFTHESGDPSYHVPGYFAADGDAANTSATEGSIWRAHLSPDKTGKWTYQVSFVQGKQVATEGGGKAFAPFDGQQGSFNIAPSDKSGRDFRSKGRLEYTGQHYLQFAGNGKSFIKAGPDSPETLLAYADIDNTQSYKKIAPLKTWGPHLQDWRTGDPTWQGDKGKGLIGALNYLSEKGLNSFSFLTYNAAGDGDNIWPFTRRDSKYHYDCSKLDQWGVVFSHAIHKGLHLHFKLQENENDDNRLTQHRNDGIVKESLDGGKTGPERKLYLRELIARYSHHLALLWDLGEENTQSTEEQKAMAQYIADTDPYDHNIIIHTFPFEQDSTYPDLLGKQSALTGASLQNSWDSAHQWTLKWVRESQLSGKPWVVANDEQNPWWVGVPPDIGYKGYSGKTNDDKIVPHDQHDIRKYTLWGTLMAGGAGVEYLFGYHVAENDLNLEDFRSRDQTWDYCRHAINFFENENLPLNQMTNANALIGNLENDNSRYCLAQEGKVYLVYLPEGGDTSLNLENVSGSYSLSWYNPRTGGPLLSAEKLTGGPSLTITAPDDQDWLGLIRLK